MENRNVFFFDNTSLPTEAFKEEKKTCFFLCVKLFKQNEHESSFFKKVCFCFVSTKSVFTPCPSQWVNKTLCRKEARKFLYFSVWVEVLVRKCAFFFWNKSFERRLKNVIQSHFNFKLFLPLTPSSKKVIFVIWNGVFDDPTHPLPRMTSLCSVPLWSE